MAMAPGATENLRGGSIQPVMSMRMKILTMIAKMTMTMCQNLSKTLTLMGMGLFLHQNFGRNMAMGILKQV